MIKGIVAVAANDVIGVNGGLPWQLPEDLAYFKAMTDGHVLIMGRLTWESLGRRLPNRKHLVISASYPRGRSSNDIAPDLRTPAVDDAIAYAQAQWPEKDIFIIGGAGIFRIATRYIEEWLITEIDLSPEGDTRFERSLLTGFTAVTPVQWSKAKNGIRYRMLKYTKE